MIFLKTEDEIELMRAANQLVSRTLTEVGKLVNPGVTTKDLDKVAGEFIRDHGAIPTFYGFPNPYGAPFPANICTSINDVVVHGIPDETPLEEGDIVSIDCGALLNGFNGDSCYTFRVGNVSTEINALLKTTKEALYKGIEMAVNGRRIGDVSHAIESHCTEHGYGVVREFVGHGIGRDMHEEPHVPNYGKAGNGKLIRNDNSCTQRKARDTLLVRGNRKDRESVLRQQITSYGKTGSYRTRWCYCRVSLERNVSCRAGEDRCADYLHNLW